MNKVIYLATSYKCSACKCQKQLLIETLKTRNDIKLVEKDVNDIPEWIKNEIIINQFPTTILTENNKIICAFFGTRKIKDINNIFLYNNY